MLSINFWNILWTVVNLLVLYVVFRKFLYQRVMNVIEAREEMVKKQFDDAKKSEEDARKLKEIKESLYFLAEQKQTNLFRMARRLLDHHGNPSLVREIQEEAWKLTSHPEILLDEDELKYALLV